MVGVGQVCIDLVARVPRLPAAGGKARAHEISRRPGGQVATALLACARLGLRCAFVGAVGEDAAAEESLAPLVAAGVDVSGVRHVPGARTQEALIWVEDESGERTIVWDRDPALTRTPQDLPRATLASGRALLVDPGHGEACVAAARWAREQGVPVVLDADQAEPGIEALLAAADFPIVSQAFAETFYGTHSVNEALERLAALGARMPVVTLGERGCLARRGDRLLESPGFPVAARDTTGAGDAFHAAFVWGLLEGLDAERVLRAANAAAALNCRALGAQGGLPDRTTLEAFLETSLRP